MIIPEFEKTDTPTADEVPAGGYSTRWMEAESRLFYPVPLRSPFGEEAYRTMIVLGTAQPILEELMPEFVWGRRLFAFLLLLVVLFSVRQTILPSPSPVLTLGDRPSFWFQQKQRYRRLYLWF